jgi:hypothetical protein
MDMSTNNGGLLTEGFEKEIPRVEETSETGLLELGAVSQTQGGLLGFFFDIGNGYQWAP